MGVLRGAIDLLLSFVFLLKGTAALSRSGRMKTQFRTIKKLLSVLWLGAVLTIPQVGLADLLPITQSQRDAHRNAFSGGEGCVTVGSYDSGTYLWQQSLRCAGESLQVMGADGTTYLNVVSERKSLTAFVDNVGNLLGGSYTWFAEIPELGISDVELVGAGNVIDVLYIDSELYIDPGDDLENFVGPELSVLALIELDFVHSALGGIGPVVLWEPYAEVFWPGCGETLGAICEPWSTSISNYDNWSGTVFDYLGRTILVPEPGALALLFIGFAAIGLARRRKVA